VKFGAYTKGLREAKGLSLRHVARVVGIEPSYLSKIEGDERKASEEVLESLAGVLDVEPNLFLAMAGKITQEFQDAIQARPEAFAALIKSAIPATTPDILKAARTVRDGDW